MTEMTAGRVLHMTLATVGATPLACVWVGDDTSQATLLYVALEPSDPHSVLLFKGSLVRLLARAYHTRQRVVVYHDGAGSEIEVAVLPRRQVSIVGPSYRDDLFSVTGADFPADSTLYFEDDDGDVEEVEVDLARPHWLLVRELPIRTGRYWAWVEGSGLVSERVSVKVTFGDWHAVRTLYPGPPRSTPYTLVIAANRAYEWGSSTVGPDDVMYDLSVFRESVADTLRSLLTLPEDVIHRDGLDQEIRFVLIRGSPGANEENALLRRTDGVWRPVPSRAKALAERYGEQPDIVMAIHSTTLFGASVSRESVDDPDGPSWAYTLDEHELVHGLFTETPGTCLLKFDDLNDTTALHEFLHAVGDASAGLADLYPTTPGIQPGGGGDVAVNRKAYTPDEDGPPADFGTYNGVTFATEVDAPWPTSHERAYYPKLIDPTRPHIMGPVWLSMSPRECRLDELSYAWVRDRLMQKVLRPDA